MPVVRLKWPGLRPRDSDGGGLDSVRSHYRQVLLAARPAGHPRRAFETPLELDSRLEPLADEGAARALSNLTNLYDVVRYGGHLETGEEIAACERRRRRVRRRTASIGRSRPRRRRSHRRDGAGIDVLAKVIAASGFAGGNRG